MENNAFVPGTVPSGIFTLTTLQSLLLANSALNGTVPPGIGNLTKLRYVEDCRVVQAPGDS